MIELAINMAYNEIRHRARLVKDYGEVPPVVADGGGAFTPSTRAFLDQVSNECLEKPFDARNLRAIVQRAARSRPP